eukprot:873711-Prorocentrum_minimum.AAC.2
MVNADVTYLSCRCRSDQIYWLADYCRLLTQHVRLLGRVETTHEGNRACPTSLLLWTPRRWPRCPWPLAPPPSAQHNPRQRRSARVIAARKQHRFRSDRAEADGKGAKVDGKRAKADGKGAEVDAKGAEADGKGANMYAKGAEADGRGDSPAPPSRAR